MILPRENFRFFYEAVSRRFSDRAPVLVSGEVEVKALENALWAVKADCMNHHENVEWSTLQMTGVRCGD